MEHRFPQSTGSEITENYILRNKEENVVEKSYLSREELKEYKKVQEVLLKFSRTIPKNKSDLRKSLINIATSLMMLLAILEDTPHQETTDIRTKNAKANQQHKFNENNTSTENEIIPKKKNGHLGQMKDYEQIPRVTIKKLCNNNEPAYVSYIDRSLHENDECRINVQKPDSGSSQYIPLQRENATQTFLQKDEICNAQLNDQTEIVFECKNVEPTITSFAQPKLDYLSKNQFQDAKISEPIRATIKDERFDMVKKEYLDDNIEKVNLNNDCESNGKNEIIPPLNSIHDSKKSEKLETCSKKMKKNSNLKVHKDTAHNHATHSCEICGKKFLQRNKLKIHTEVVHNGQKLYKCDTCGKTFVLKNKLDRHINSIHIDLACDESRKTFAQKDYLINHIGSVHNGKKYHDHGTRGKAFRQKVSLKEHIESPRRSITHPCDSCGKTFKRKSSLKNHNDFVHKNLKHHKCDRCQKAFSSKGNLNLHMNTAHNGITHTCDLCEKIFTQKSYLRVHIDIVHMGKRKLFKCDECPKSFNYKCDRTSHIDLVHKGITHPCDLCRKVFRQKSGLKLHKDSVHKGITYPCDYCRKVFSQKSHLKMHNDSVHNGITHQCDQCEKSFAKQANLKLHINEVHNGKK